MCMECLPTFYHIDLSHLTIDLSQIDVGTVNIQSDPMDPLRVFFRAFPGGVTPGQRLKSITQVGLE